MTSPSRPEPVPHLTAREIAILDLVARGLGDKTIATRLALSPGTVRNRLTRLYRKLGVPGRTAAALRWHVEQTGDATFAAPHSIQSADRRTPQK